MCVCNSKIIRNVIYDILLDGYPSNENLLHIVHTTVVC